MVQTNETKKKRRARKQRKKVQLMPRARARETHQNEIESAAGLVVINMCVVDGCWARCSDRFLLFFSERCLRAKTQICVEIESFVAFTLNLGLGALRPVEVGRV